MRREMVEKEREEGWMMMMIIREVGGGEVLKAKGP